MTINLAVLVLSSSFTSTYFNYPTQELQSGAFTDNLINDFLKSGVHSHQIMALRSIELLLLVIGLGNRLLTPYLHLLSACKVRTATQLNGNFKNSSNPE